MTESQEDKTKLAYETFDCFFKHYEPLDYNSKMVLEIFFKVAMEKRRGLHLPGKTEQK